MPTFTAGREIDALIAKEVFGYEVRCECYTSLLPDLPPLASMLRVYRGDRSTGRRADRALPYYSLDKGAAFEVVERLVALGHRVEFRTITNNLICVALNSADGSEEYWAETMPLAVCYAACHALGLDVDLAGPLPICA